MTNIELIETIHTKLVQGDISKMSGSEVCILVQEANTAFLGLTDKDEIEKCIVLCFEIINTVRKEASNRLKGKVH